MTTWDESGWFPPVDPPVDGGLPLDEAEAIADTWWDIDPFYAAGLAWQQYAAQLVAGGTGDGIASGAGGAVTAVSTGVQTVTYSKPTVLEAYGAAERKADWFFAHSTHGNASLASLRLQRPDVAARRTGMMLVFTDDWTGP
jgi:hypothetical protein